MRRCRSAGYVSGARPGARASFLDSTIGYSPLSAAVAGDSGALPVPRTRSEQDIAAWLDRTHSRFAILLFQQLMSWCRKRDSNPRPRHYE
jgi:hypothetical protein